MKKTKAERGGRPFANDDLLNIQTELTDAIQAQFLGKGPFILTGCQVSGASTGANVTAGIVCLNGELLRFAGASGVVLPAQFQAGAVVLSAPRPYQTGGTRNCMEEKPAVLVASNPAYTGGEFLPFDSWGGKTWDHVQRALHWAVGDVKPTANLVLADFDSAGLGKPGTSVWGWALCDGQNNRPNLSEKFIAGANPANPAYALNATGGVAEVTLNISQMPYHEHDVQIPYGQSNNGQGQPVRTDSRNDGQRTYKAAGVGGGQAHTNIPPYCALGMLQWVGY